MTYVLSDVHGEIDRWNRMLELIQLSDEDTLIVIGDAIDRGKQGVEILRDIMGRPNVQFVVGNHEYMMLDTFWSGNDYDARRLWTRNGGGETYRTMVYRIPTEERLRILRFIQQSPSFLDIEVNGREYHICHGMPSHDLITRLWDRPEPPPTEPPIPGKTCIVGHTATIWLYELEEGYDPNTPLKIWYGPGLIDVDCGCGSGHKLRRLACLRLEDLEEFYT